MKLYQDYDLYIGKDLINSQMKSADLDLFFVIDGKVNAQIAGKDRLLKKEDVAVANVGESRRLSARGETIICVVRFNKSFIWDYYNMEYPVFDIPEDETVSERMEKLREIFHNIVYIKLFEKRNTQGNFYCQLYRLLDHIFDYFREDTSSMPQQYEDNKIDIVMSYIHDNFRYKISMDEIADKLYMSKSSLSRLFKKETGEYFADYVNQLKLEAVVEDLCYTEKGITTIAMDSGFTNISSLNRVFKTVYGVTPTEYRAKERKNLQMREKKAAQVEEEIRKEILNKGFGNQIVHDAKDLSVSTSVSKTSHFEHVWSKCINMGTVSEMVLSNLQFHTEFLAQQLGFTHVRMWNVFSAKMMITDGSERDSYNYTQLDLVLDFLIERHLHPFLDLGGRPNTAIQSPGKPIYFEYESVEFQSPKAWMNLIEDMIRHLFRRYGSEELNQWIFELSFDLTHKDKLQMRGLRYIDAFSHLFRAVKKYAPLARVGGPSMQYDLVSDKDFIDYCRICMAKGVMPDFISVLEFPYKTDKDMSYHRSPERTEGVNDIKRVRGLMDSVGMKDTPIYVSEFSSSISNRNYLNDGCYRGTYFIRRMRELGTVADVICPWCGSDWISSYYDSGKVTNGASGLITKDAIKKPVYYALYFMNLLGEELIYACDGCIITRKGEREYAILCYNYKRLSEDYYLITEKQVEVNRTETLNADHDSLNISITLSGMVDSISQEGYVIKKMRMNCSRGSVLSEWARYGYENDLKRQDIKYINNVCIPYQERNHKKCVDGTISLGLTLAEQEMTLIQIMDE